VNDQARPSHAFAHDSPFGEDSLEKQLFHREEDYSSTEDPVFRDHLTHQPSERLLNFFKNQYALARKTIQRVFP
jgi:hypothetical protein